MDLKNYYDKAYSHYLASSDEVPKSQAWPGSLALIRKANQINLLNKEHLRVVELGVGICPNYLHIEKLFPQLRYWGVEHSDIAKNFCQKKFNNEAVAPLFVTHLNEIPPAENLDLVIDSHLLHCLILDEDRHQFLTDIHARLDSGGVFLGEIMISSKSRMNAFYEQHQYYPEEAISDDYYSQKINQQWITSRRIKSAFAIEQELLQAGFKIQYFQVMAGRYIQLNPDRLLADFDPEVLHFICTKE